MYVFSTSHRPLFRCYCLLLEEKRTMAPPQARLCVVLLGTFISSFLECRELEGYEFPVYSTNFCPRNGREWKSRSSAINCTESNGYMCLPNENRTELLEFCYIYPQISIEKDICLYLVKRYSKVDAYYCRNFKNGCPKLNYLSSEMFKYQSCSQIKNGCFSAELNCKSVIPPDSTEPTKKIPGPSANDRYSTINDLVIFGTVTGLFTTICVLSVLCIVFRRKFTTCQESSDEEKTEEQEQLLSDTNDLKEKSFYEEALLDVWQQDDKLFVTTKTCEEVENKIKTQNLVIVTGHSGSGKSAIIHHIALQYKTQGWKVKAVDSVEDFKVAYSSMNSDSRTFFVIDDPFGKESFDKFAYDSWVKIEWFIRAKVLNNETNCNVIERTNDSDGKYENNLIDKTTSNKNNRSNNSGDKNKQSKQNLKMMMSSRKFLPHVNTVHGLLNRDSFIFDISRDQCKLTDLEKLAIFQKYTGLTIESSDMLAAIVRTEIYFPLLCMLYSKNITYQEQGARFFEKPGEVLEEELRSFRENDKVKYCSLVLLVFFNNSFSVDILDEDESAEKKFKRALDLCGIEYTARSTIIDKLDLLDRFLVRKVSNTYHFSHDFVMEVFNNVFGTDYPIDMIEHADIGFIGRKVKISNCTLDNDILIINPNEKKKIDALGKRLYSEIFGDRFLDVILNPCLRNESVIHIFKEEMTRNPEKLENLLERKKQRSETKKEKNKSVFSISSRLSFVTLESEISPLFTLISFCHNDLSLFCLKRLKKIDFTKNFLFSAVCCNGSIEMFNMFPKEYEKQFLTEKWKYHYPIHIVSTFHNYEMLDKLLKIGAHVNQQFLFDETPLHLAVTGFTEEKDINLETSLPERRDATVRLLLNNDANVNVHWFQKYCPLYKACRYGCESTVKILLNNDADINHRSRRNKYPISSASKHGHENVVRLLIKSGAKLLSNIYPLEATPLYKAFENGDEKVVRLLLESLADIGLCDRDKNYSLYKACENGYESIVQLLLRNDANFNVVDRYTENTSPLSKACENGHENIVQLLIDKGANVNNDADENQGGPILGACRGGHESIVKLLLNYGAAINSCDKNEISPLFLACQIGSESIVQILLDKGANINAVSKCRGTPLREACKNEHESIVRLLVNNGANVNLCSKDKVAPIHEACKNGHESIIQILLNKNASINAVACNIDWGSPLLEVCKNKHESIVRLLLENGADVNLCNENYITPILEACKNGHYNIVNILLDDGAKINVISRNMESPLREACKNGHESIVRLLVEKGADVNLRSDDYNTPKNRVCSTGYQNIVEIVAMGREEIEKITMNMGNPLLEACRNGHESIVKLLVENGADVNLCSENFITPILDACKNGHEKIVQFLVEKGAKLNVISSDMESPLREACKNGHESIVSLLLKNGADVNLCSDDYTTPKNEVNKHEHESFVRLLDSEDLQFPPGFNNMGNPLIDACRNGHESIVRLLVAYDANVNLCCSENYITPILEACKNGHEKIVECLVEEGAKLNVISVDMESPLREACENGHKSIVSLLLKNGADVNLCSKDYATSKNEVYKHKTYFESLVSMGLIITDDNTDTMTSPLHVACRNGYENIVRLLFEKDANVNLRSKDNTTPIHGACFGGHESIVKILVDKGADINAFSMSYESPLLNACHNGNENVVKLLLQKGANINSSSERKLIPPLTTCEMVGYDGPIHKACSAGHENIVKLLLEKGENINEDGENGRSPLHSACMANQDDIVKLLLEKKADINVESKRLGSPIHQACRMGYYSIVKLLITEGADINAVGASGSPLHQACENGHKNIVRLLLKKDAKIDVYNGNGKTPLDIAIEYGNDSIVQLVKDKCSEFDVKSDISESPLLETCKN